MWIERMIAKVDGESSSAGSAGSVGSVEEEGVPVVCSVVFVGAVGVARRDASAVSEECVRCSVNAFASLFKVSCDVFMLFMRVSAFK